VERGIAELTTNLERAQQALARARIARARGDETGEDESTILRPYGALSGRTTLDLLGEMRDRRFDGDGSIAALAYHLRVLVRERTFADLRPRLRALPSRFLVVEEQALSVRAALAELAGGGRPERARSIERNLGHLAGSVARVIAERRAEAADAGRRFDEFVAPDVDRPRTKALERAERFLGATDALMDEMLDFLRTRHGGEIRSLGSLHAALRLAELDDLAKRRTRALRVTSLLRAAGFASSIERRASVEASPAGLSFGVDLVAPRVDDVRLLPGADVEGVIAERAFLAATGRALALLEAHPGSSPHLRRPRRGFVGRAIGAVFVRAGFDVRRLRSIDAPEVARERARRLAAAATLVAMRVDATRALGRATTEDFHRATGVEWDPGFVALACASGDAETHFDAAHAGLAWATALRERYDEEFLRHAATREWIGTLFSRQALEPPETFDAELAAGDDVARELRGFFDGRV